MNNHDSPPRPVIALDFDGTICQNAYPDIGEPNWHVIEKAKQCQEQGAYLILWTCRGGQMLEKAVAACTEWGLTFDAINENLPEWREAYGTDPPEDRCNRILGRPLGHRRRNLRPPQFSVRS